MKEYFVYLSAQRTQEVYVIAGYLADFWLFVRNSV